MKLIADLHIHSHFSRATSKELEPVHIEYWAKIKGVNIVGTGDFTHPAWKDELEKYLEPAEQGLYKLKKEFVIENPVKKPDIVRFILSAEISNIYKKNDKVRKIHNVLLAPDFETVKKIQKELDRRKFNIRSDGRPILGMDSRDLLEMLMEIDERIVFIPAHIWTPWFAVLGSKSGFDSIHECFEDMTKYIFALETGLSSDLPMNWICSFLDDFNLISNSDAHSPEKLGRNANIFNIDLSYYNLVNALKDKNSDQFIGTIDLYPQEGKYHYDGHRNCGIRFNPVETVEHNSLCPVCGKPLTKGVAHRVASLADRNDPLLRPHRKQFSYIIPLKEILAEINKTGPNTIKVKKNYDNIISKLGSELFILLNSDIAEIKKYSGELLAEAINRMRSGHVIIEEGFDGQYGTIKLFEPGELEALGNKFIFLTKSMKENYKQRKLLNFDIARFRELKSQQNSKDNLQNQNFGQISINQEQKKAIEHFKGPALIIAGPGTGKTYILTQRVAWLVEKQSVTPENILAITFTNQATKEMRSRLIKLLNLKANKLTISTFHSLGYMILKEAFPNKEFVIITDIDKEQILKIIGVPNKQIKKIVSYISGYKNLLNKEYDSEFETFFKKYENFLNKNNLVDFDDLIYKTLILLEKNSLLLNSLQKKWDFILVDEFQDINKAQYKLLNLLAEETKSNIFVIGDPNQSIYSFRGANNKIIETFKTYYNPIIYTIETSYRVPQKILQASNNILETKQTLKGLSDGTKIKILDHPTEKSEAEYIAREIEKIIGGVHFFSLDSKVIDNTTEAQVKSLSEIGILVRTRHQFEPLIKALSDHNIPYEVIGNKPFFLKDNFVELIDYLKFILYPENKFLKLKIGEKALFVEQIDLSKEPYHIVKQVIKLINFNSENIERFLFIAKEFNNLKSFLRSLEIADVQDDLTLNHESVKIMTLHASKGLEFEVVFIAGLEKGILPYTIYRKNTDISEERRLFYVGMTRAKKLLYLTYAKTRNFMNRQYQLEPSPFIKDIKEELLVKEKNTYKKNKPEDKQLRLF